jgi:hypothetical protein
MSKSYGGTLAESQRVLAHVTSMRAVADACQAYTKAIQGNNYRSATDKTRTLNNLTQRMITAVEAWEQTK